MTGELDTVPAAVAAIANGGMALVVDDEDRENEGDLVLAAEKATAANIGFLVRHTSGVLCVPMTGDDLDRLELPPMTAVNQDPKATAYTVSVDAAAGIGTGISAADRAHTMRLLADPGATPRDFTRPGHVFPLRAHPRGVLGRQGHTEAAVDLVRMAGLRPAGVIAEVVRDDGSMARLPDLLTMARVHGIPIISIAELIAHRRRLEPGVVRVVETRLPTRFGEFRLIGYRDPNDRAEHLALVLGAPGERDVLTRVHSECLTGDAFGSLRCDCGEQLDAALRAVAAEGRGVVVYLRGQEGRGIGLLNKLRAYELQDGGADTVDANLRLGLPVDARHYGAAARILDDLGVRSVRLLSNNPAKQAGLTEHGIAVERRIPLQTSPTEHNVRYLRAKRDRMRHQLSEVDAAALAR
ncbi:bifunctional 3,4-dihydroxy-2-butanone-4-phosphate synthase/GTP cyclohydrolase II [Nocardia implantans]|uniref:Riboflavin biosynthesis protein RibBA n=1 Tax=Nocardia implantans TaxID=3108168 RepID=A0ABU6ASC6_9NOCA|nr:MULTISPECIES: bifunctional 3,4-dihydroxy-2-butanone-4-phosphate synthase/GTP cyclohydrolase II [unclassified Nocardia]MBF6191831.1 bifunctional 3,4-dihydroxy-2-butanone-4-phosphate synthase/GTP cyclohydrolase II [Nocardia beijingensis]MEA3527857.1 bifunctional 3,4-dihydroxy-2-butanone-4-phosphate synthase/GTP cyclohydrolase II [Nocardia sp. CDC192]MEB3510391.1 bifunctional 3,4-dihydroxy-2-butanone-4-phosphate synthase/GTP cyclohydrolase II [Nocardia sp. CDC186]